MVTAIIITFFCLLMECVLHIVFKRLIIRGSLVISFFVSFTLLFLTLTGLHVAAWFHYGGTIVDWIGFYLADLVVYLCLSYCYINFINIGNASVRIKALYDICLSAEGVTAQQILDGYNSEIILGIRLRRLLESGQIKMTDNIYFLGKPRQVLLALFFKFWRDLILGKGKSGVIC